MNKKSRAICWCLVFSTSISQVGCVSSGRASKAVPVPTSKSEALSNEVDKAAQIQNDAKQRKDQIDQWLRVASMAMDAGQNDYARKVLIDVTGMFQGIVIDKVFQEREQSALKTVGGKEEEGFFLGDPYEQMLAYFYLGLLDFQAGDYALARKSFGNASRADAEGGTEGYKSDCYLAMLLEGVSALRMGDQSTAADAFRFAARAFSFRQKMPRLQKALYEAADSVQQTEPDGKLLNRLNHAIPLVSENLASAVSSTDDIVVAVHSAFEMARGMLGKPEKKSPAALLLDECEGKDKIAQASELLGKLESNTEQHLTPALLEDVRNAEAEFGKLIAACSDSRTNAFILLQSGQAPAKIRGGQYGEIIQFQTYPDPVRYALSTIQQADVPNAPLLAFVPVPAESITYQATTQGGRVMDHILKGRAEFRDNMNVASGIALSVVPAAISAGAVAASTIVTTTVTTVTYSVSSTGAVTATTTTSTSAAPAGAAAATPFLIAAAAAIIIYKGSKMIADATHPEGDIRGWHELPNQFLFICGTLAPGEYELTNAGFDRLGQLVPQQNEKKIFIVGTDKPALIVSGTPWR